MRKILLAFIVVLFLAFPTIACDKPCQRTCRILVDNSTDELLTVVVDDGHVGWVRGFEAGEKGVFGYRLRVGKYKIRIIQGKEDKEYPIEITEEDVEGCRQKCEGKGDVVLLEVSK